MPALPKDPGTPASQMFRVEGGKNRYIHEVTVCTTPRLQVAADRRAAARSRAVRARGVRQRQAHRRGRGPPSRQDLLQSCLPAGSGFPAAWLRQWIDLYGAVKPQRQVTVKTFSTMAIALALAASAANGDTSLRTRIPGLELVSQGNCQKFARTVKQWDTPVAEAVRRGYFTPPQATTCLSSRISGLHADLPASGFSQGRPIIHRALARKRRGPESGSHKG